MVLQALAVLSRSRLGLVGACLLWGILQIDGSAMSGPVLTAHYLSPEKMAEGAAAVARVRIGKISTIAIDNRVYTDIEAELVDLWKGAANGGTIRIRQPGGRLGNLVTYAGPQPPWRHGQEWVLALARPEQGWWTVYGIKQGAFRIEADTAVREFSGFGLLDPVPPTLQNGRESISLADLKSRMSGRLPPAGHPPGMRRDSWPRGAPAMSNPAVPKPSPSSRNRWFFLLVACIVLLVWGMLKRRGTA